MKNDYALKYLGKRVKVVIDRALGSSHPKYGFIYPLNYGYIPGTVAPDGEGIDAYVVGVFEPLKEFAGECIAIVNREDDNDDKLVIVPEGKLYSSEQITALVEFQERFFTSRVVHSHHNYSFKNSKNFLEKEL